MLTSSILRKQHPGRVAHRKLSLPTGSSNPFPTQNPLSGHRHRLHNLVRVLYSLADRPGNTNGICSEVADRRVA